MHTQLLKDSEEDERNYQNAWNKLKADNEAAATSVLEGTRELATVAKTLVHPDVHPAQQFCGAQRKEHGAAGKGCGGTGTLRGSSRQRPTIGPVVFVKANAGQPRIRSTQEVPVPHGLA